MSTKRVLSPWRNWVPSGLMSSSAGKSARNGQWAIQCAIDVLESRQLLSAVVHTDLPDYAPASTAVISTRNNKQGGPNFRIGERVEFQVLHTDGIPNTGGGHQVWRVTDGGRRDLDGKANGRIRTTWYVNPDDSANSTFTLTATGLSSRAVAQATFTDAAATAIVTYPANNAFLVAGGWTGAITGTAQQPGGPGILNVKLNIKKTTGTSTNQYWTGAAWANSPSTTYVTATGTTNWSYAIATLSDAIYTITVRVTDINNVVATMPTSVFTVDVAAPTLTNFYASSNNYKDPAYSTSPYFTASAADATTNVVFAEYFIDTQGPDGTGILFNAFTPAKGVSLNGTLPTAIFDSLAEGQHNIIGHSRDAAGNWSLPSSWSVWYKDLTGPSTSGATVTPPTANMPPTFTATVTDIGSGYHNLTGAEYFVDTVGAPGTGKSMNPVGGYFNFANQTPSSYTVTKPVTATLTQAEFDALSDGTHTLSIRGQDVAGNWGAVTSVSFSKDVQLPMASVTAPGLGSNLSAIPFTLTFSTPVTGLTTAGIAVTNGTIGTLTGSGTTYTVTVIPAVQGNVTVQVLGGAAENEAVAGKFNTVSNTASAVYDIIVPTVTSISSISNHLMSTFYNTVIFTVVFSENVTISGAPQLALNSGGFATYYADNNSTQIRFQYKALAGHAASPLDFASGNYLSGGTIKDIGGNDAILPTAGAVNSWTPRNITVDAVAPTVSVTPTATATKLSPILFTIRFSENVTGMTAAQINVTNGTKGAFTGAGTYYTLSVTPTAQGAVTAQVIGAAASDVGSNYSVQSNIASVVYDTVAPTTSISLAGTLGLNGWYKEAVTVTLSGMDATSGVGQTQYSLGGTTWQTYTGAFVVSAQGLSSLQYYSTDNAGNVGATGSKSFKIDSIAPTVTGLFVRGSAWLTAFKTHLASHAMGDATLGYAIPVGSGAQLKTLPWVNMNTIAVAFSEDVSIDKSDLALTGITLPAYDVAGSTFSYDNVNHVATWVLPAVLTSDKLLLNVNADGVSPVADMAGLSLDGEWTNPVSTTSVSSSVFASGNAAAGGNFAFRFNALPGDANQNTVVQATDSVQIRNGLNLTPTSALFSAFADLNGNGVIQATDSVACRNNLNRSLPAGSPPVGVFASSLLFAKSPDAFDLLGVASSIEL